MKKQNRQLVENQEVGIRATGEPLPVPSVAATDGQTLNTRPAAPNAKAAAATRKRREDGERSRQAILLAAAKLATERGLGGLSIGALAEHLGMSKSGLFAHFGSKEELELATVDTAAEIFRGEVLARTQGVEGGLARFCAMCDAFLSHLERQVFPGGCFFASVAAEFDTQPGRVRDRVFEIQHEWFGGLLKCIQQAQAEGEIDSKLDPIQITFEGNAMLLMANGAWVMMHNPVVLQRARAGIEHVIERAKTYVRPSARLTS